MRNYRQPKTAERGRVSPSQEKFLNYFFQYKMVSPASIYTKNNKTDTVGCIYINTHTHTAIMVIIREETINWRVKGRHGRNLRERPGECAEGRKGRGKVMLILF